jgi:hypothetical protein
MQTTSRAGRRAAAKLNLPTDTAGSDGARLSTAVRSLSAAVMAVVGVIVVALVGAIDHLALPAAGAGPLLTWSLWGAVAGTVGAVAGTITWRNLGRSGETASKALAKVTAPAERIAEKVSDAAVQRFAAKFVTVPADAVALLRRGGWMVQPAHDQLPFVVAVSRAGAVLIAAAESHDEVPGDCAALKQLNQLRIEDSELASLPAVLIITDAAKLDPSKVGSVTVCSRTSFPKTLQRLTRKH